MRLSTASPEIQSQMAPRPAGARKSVDKPMYVLLHLTLSLHVSQWLFALPSVPERIVDTRRHRQLSHLGLACFANALVDSHRTFGCKAVGL